MSIEFSVRRYFSTDAQLWNGFVANANNGTFLLNRSFMDYHSSRFKDFSLMVFNKKQLVALLPAHQLNNTVYSHQGLSYGGVVVSPQVRFEIHVEVFRVLLHHLHQQHIELLHLKPIPEIYQRYVDHSEQLIFQWLNATKVRTDIYSYIPKGKYEQPNRNRKRAITTAQTNGIKVKESADLSLFWETILVPNLKKRFEVEPVHSLEEIKLLKKSFSKNILFYGSYHLGTLKAGAVVFVMEKVLHVQYSSGDEDRSSGALDILFDHIIRTYNSSHTVSFGTSSENQGQYINKGLLNWKESFSKVNSVQAFYSLNTAHYIQLEQRIR